METVIAELMARRGYAHAQTSDARCNAWKVVVGDELAASTRAGNIHRGILEVIVTNSIVIQELSFRKQELVGRLARELPSENIMDIRFRIGVID